jgi:hypothetical protein
MRVGVENVIVFLSAGRYSKNARLIRSEIYRRDARYDTRWSLEMIYSRMSLITLVPYADFS